jgi:hypothetical protein
LEKKSRDLHNELGWKIFLPHLQKREKKEYKKQRIDVLIEGRLRNTPLSVDCGVVAKSTK